MSWVIFNYCTLVISLPHFTPLLPDLLLKRTSIWAQAHNFWRIFHPESLLYYGHHRRCSSLLVIIWDVMIFVTVEQFSGGSSYHDNEHLPACTVWDLQKARRGNLLSKYAYSIKKKILFLVIESERNYQSW